MRSLSPTPPAPEALALYQTPAERLEARAFNQWYLAGNRRRGLRAKGLAVPFDPAFAPANGGWERLPAGFCGPPELVLLGVRLRWQSYPARARSGQAPAVDPDAYYDGSAYYWSDTRAHSGTRQARYPSDAPDLDRFRTW